MFGRKGINLVLLLSNYRIPTGSQAMGQGLAGSSALEVSTELEVLGVEETPEGPMLSEKETKGGSDIEGQAARYEE